MSNQPNNISNNFGFKATVYQVFIASPSDVKDERQIIKNVLYRWNTHHSCEKQKVFLPITWEDNSYPESGTSPQIAINKQVLKDADLLIGVFCSRFGTQTENYPSGSAEEYREHLDSHKPAMLYFCNDPIERHNLDDDQYQALKQFKDSCQNKSFYREYCKNEFEKLLYDNLINLVNKDPHFATTEPISENQHILSQQSTNTEIQLDNIAKEMLITACQTNEDITCMEMLNCIEIGPNGHYQRFDMRQKKAIADYKAALEFLETNYLIKDRGNKREIFAITKKGYEWVERNTSTEMITDNL
jgi:hypothetical protein